MSFTSSGGGGAMPSSRLLALLQGLQGASPDGANFSPAAYPRSRLDRSPPPRCGRDGVGLNRPTR
jgi:hypothetical protein